MKVQRMRPIRGDSELDQPFFGHLMDSVLVIKRLRDNQT